jgi:hypothetical protein
MQQPIIGKRVPCHDRDWVKQLHKTINTTVSTYFRNIPPFFLLSPIITTTRIIFQLDLQSLQPPTAVDDMEILAEDGGRGIQQ